MGLIRAGLNAVGGTLASQWKEYFYADALPEDVLATRALKKTKGRFGGSRSEDDNIISNGSSSPSPRPVHDDRRSGAHCGFLRRARRVRV